jgi:hypothetical protein
MAQIPVNSIGALTMNMLSYLKGLLSENLRVVILCHCRNWFYKVVGFTGISQFDMFQIQNGNGLCDSVVLPGFHLSVFGTSVENGGQKGLI